MCACMCELGHRALTPEHAILMSYLWRASKAASTLLALFDAEDIDVVLLHYFTLSFVLFGFCLVVQTTAVDVLVQ